MQRSSPTPIQIWNIDVLAQLRAIRMDWLDRHSPYRPSGLNLFFLGSQCLRITEFDCRADFPTPMLITSIADTFPALRCLRLRQANIWCGLCNTCSTVYFADPVPIEIVYTNGLGLPVRSFISWAFWYTSDP